MAEMALEQTLDLGDYLAAFRRRRLMISLIAAVVLSIGLFIAYTLPPTYESRATILIEEQEIPSDLVRTTVTSYAGQRIQIISQRVMTRSNLLELIDKYGLYEKERKRKPLEQILAGMRQDIKVETIQAQVRDPRGGGAGVATIAFSVGFAGEYPQLVQKVASELTSLYLNENLKTRSEKTAETYDFLTAEADRLNAEIMRLDVALSDFKEKNINLLPESRSLIEDQKRRTESEIGQIEDQLQTSKETKIYLQGQLALLDPYDYSENDDTGSISPARRLKLLRTNYITLYSRYSPDHPDVISTKREIKALEKEVGVVDTQAEQFARLETLQQELVIAEQAYSDEHPDVKSLKRQIATLEESIRNATPADDTTAAENPANPAYLNLQSQIERMDIQDKLYRQRQQLLKEKLADYEDRLLQLPKIEGQYRALVRAYGNATSRYQELKAKQMTAEVAQSMEKERKGEKFTLIDPAILPQEPVSPNRPAIVFLSLVLALGAGVGAAVAAETLNSAVRGTKGVANILGVAPLAVIPYISVDTEINRRSTWKKLIVLSLVIGVVVLVLLVHFFYSPLDILWFRGLRKADNIIGG